jgi:hypothetical protein
VVHWLDRPLQQPNFLLAFGSFQHQPAEFAHGKLGYQNGLL